MPPPSCQPPGHQISNNHPQPGVTLKLSRMAAKGSDKPKITPAMQQFHRFKKQFPDCVLFFRMGDFYELFYDDAKLAHRVMGVTLTQRTEGVPMAGVPYHAVESYLKKMIQAGYRVAICDQVQDPKEAKGVVDRDVTRVMTPGTLTDDTLLDEGVANCLAAVMVHVQGQGTDAHGHEGRKDHQKSEVSIAWAELSTGQFGVGTYALTEVVDELARIRPSELLYVETATNEAPSRIKQLADAANCVATARPGWQFRQDEALDTLCKQFGVSTLSGFGLDDEDACLGPASAIVHYLMETQRAGRTTGDASQDHHIRGMHHLQPPRKQGRADYLVIDRTSLHALEIERTMRTGDAAGSLLAVLQDCRTAIGKRMLRQWLCYPLCDLDAIEQRQNAVQTLVDDSRFLDELRTVLDDIQDVQRILGRVSMNRATPRDVAALGRSCSQTRALCDLLEQRPSMESMHERLTQITAALNDLGQRIVTACVDSPPAHLREGGLFANGFDKQLDEYRALQKDGTTWLAAYQKRLIDETGVPSLKVGFNKVFGYYIEISAAQRSKFDPFFESPSASAWTRKQTLKNAERYITPELKEYEGKVLSAKERAVAREQELFDRLCNEVGKNVDALHALADAVGQLDVLACFARRAVRHDYVRPTMVAQPVLHIDAGRHPVLDDVLGDRFVPNDVALGGQVTQPQSHEAAEEEDSAKSKTSDAPRWPGGSAAQSLALITGPNMAGKSTYIRQTALITLLAHTGSFVPATSATIGLTDRIFTRIGASDELHTGQSTFMVEMTETANICHHATPASLVILDEIGRGTSTLDGLSLAWAIAEHLAGKQCRCLFATHYHELTALADQFDNVTNLNVTVREWNDEIVFLHRIARGKTDKSYGIHVAKIAGLPGEVVKRASDLLNQLEVQHHVSQHRTGDAGNKANGDRDATSKEPPANAQLPLFTEYIDHPAVGRLRETDLETLSPMQAFDLLRRLKDEVSDGKNA